MEEMNNMIEQGDQLIEPAFPANVLELFFEVLLEWLVYVSTFLL